MLYNEDQYLGRSIEQQIYSALVDTASRRMVAITGLAGFGKSVILQNVIRKLSRRNSVFFRCDFNIRKAERYYSECLYESQQKPSVEFPSDYVGMAAAFDLDGGQKTPSSQHGLGSLRKDINNYDENINL
ncbi:MAG TPA: hypothetical protein DC054_07815 [Blastocatellia bacterium]|nr:hypothetical protein [Blastocatellia bacterium]